jgi:hypothetical protein
MGEEEPLSVEGALAAGRYADEDDRGHGAGLFLPWERKSPPNNRWASGIF